LRVSYSMLWLVGQSIFLPGIKIKITRA
jgi:hypothetical protein